jgi:hypothetical protein
MSKDLCRNAVADPTLGTRLVGDLDTLTNHLRSFEKLNSNSGTMCKWCNLGCYARCTLCPGMPALYFFCNLGAAEEKLCAIHYHNRQEFGLAQEDAITMRLQVCEWMEAAVTHMALHHREYCSHLPGTGRRRRRRNQ